MPQGHEPIDGARVRALIVEDTFSIAKLVQRALLLEGISADIVDDGQAALVRYRDDPPDLIVLDLSLPRVDGIEVCRRIRQADQAAGRAPTVILMLTARGSVPDRVTGLDAGADDYLVKPFAIDEFLARIRALLRRRRPDTSTEPADDQLLRFADLSLDLDSRTARRGSRTLILTTREFDLLVFFLRRPDHVLGHDAIMPHVWGEDFFGESNVLAVTIRSLRQAMEETGETRLIQTVRGAGYVLRLPVTA